MSKPVKWRLVWSPEGKTIGVVEAVTREEAKRYVPHPYRKYMGEVRISRVGYRAAIWAKEGTFLRGGVKSLASSWFDTRKEAEDMLYAMQQPNIDHAEIEER